MLVTASQMICICIHVKTSLIYPPNSSSFFFVVVVDVSLCFSMYSVKPVSSLTLFYDVNLLVKEVGAFIVQRN